MTCRQSSINFRILYKANHLSVDLHCTQKRTNINCIYPRKRKSVIPGCEKAACVTAKFYAARLWRLQ